MSCPFRHIRPEEPTASTAAASTTPNGIGKCPVTGALAGLPETHASPEHLPAASPAANGTARCPMGPDYKTVVQATAPAMATHGVAITTAFYADLFAAVPPLKGIFNMTHQVADAAGSSPQARTLAAAVGAYANHIQDLTPLVPAVQRIAQKHVSLGILPEHYPIVGKHLLKAVESVLGDAATPEILAAWAKAYDDLAAVFIQTEGAIRQELVERPGGWADWRSFRVVDKVTESTTITSFYLQPADGGRICTFAPGQYIALRLTVPGQEFPVQRNYSLSCRDGLDHLRISVKKEAANGAPRGLASCFLHDELQVGSVVDVAPPCGNPALDLDPKDPRPLVLLSAGVGLTPMVSMLHHAADAQKAAPRRIFFIHSTQDEATHALRREVETVAEASPAVSCHFFYTRHPAPHAASGRITGPAVQGIVKDTNCAYYLCGPLAFMHDLRRSLVDLGVAAGDVRCHEFGPPEE